MERKQVDIVDTLLQPLSIVLAAPILFSELSLTRERIESFVVVLLLAVLLLVSFRQ